MSAEVLPAAIVKRKAIVYVRQSTQSQVMTNLESKRRQYDLAELARRYGFTNVETIDDDLGRSASGSVARPGFDRLVAAVCAGEVGAVLCFDASRLSRNGRDWHHLLELCGLVGARVIDTDGAYDPCRPNDRLLLGMKGSISEFELGVIRSRMLDAARAKARRGELRISVPIGYIWHRDAGLGLDPNVRVQEAVRIVFQRFRQLGSARQVLLSLSAEQMHFPRPTDGKTWVSFDWTPIRYRSVIAILKNPFYTGAYIYGKTEHRTTLVDGRVRKTYHHERPFGQWEVMIKDHHERYIEWSEFERNQKLLAANAYGKPGGPKSGRGGRALLPGLLVCGRCGRRLSVAYSGRGLGHPVYRCEGPNHMLGRRRCFIFGARRIDTAIAQQLLLAVEPMAIDAAVQAEHRYIEMQGEQQRIVDLELKQARYDASLAERRYAACDPDNRLIAAQLEKSWEAALQRVKSCEARIAELEQAKPTPEQTPDFLGLAEDLESAWKASSVTMRARQQLLSTLIADIVTDFDTSTGEIILTIRWRGGQHSEVRIRKPKSGEHGCRTSEEAVAVISSMATRWSDSDIAATLNRMAMPTGQGKTWTAHRVSSLRRVRGIHAYRSADKNGVWLTMSEAAQRLGVTNHQIRRLIKEGILRAEQVVPDAPYQILASDLQQDKVITAIDRKGRPCRAVSNNQTSMFSDT
jgi:DNA invertase Pin-like site-specific DNA recombinase